MMFSSPELPRVSTGWSARLDIEVERRGAGSLLGRRKHEGPLRVQRPFYPEGPGCPHVYLLHPPGGLVGGDALSTHVSIHPGASALFTTPAAQKLYRSPDKRSVQDVQLRVARAGSLEWFPGETICFDGARSRASTSVTLEPGAAFLGWEIVCFGRPASELPFRTGELAFRFEVRRGPTPLLIDQSVVAGGGVALEAPWGYARQPVFGALYAVAPEPVDAAPLVDAIRERLAQNPDASVTAFDELVVVRARSWSAEGARELLVRAWEGLREPLLGRRALRPRIWAV